MPDKQIPALCPKSANPYTYCPLVFVSQDDMIMRMIVAFSHEVKRVNHIESWDIERGEDARLIDAMCREVTAYMNGRIHELVRMLKEKQ